MYDLKITIPQCSQRFLILMFLISTISACGFQLRGSLDQYKEISPVYIQQDSAIELARVIKSLLVTNKILAVDKVGKSNSQLILLREAKNRRVLTIDGDGRAREYLLTYTVYFSTNIKQSPDKEVRDSITLSRSLLFNTDAVLAVTNESEVLYKDMQRNAARLILLKLQARVRDDSRSVNKASGQVQ